MSKVQNAGSNPKESRRKLNFPTAFLKYQPTINRWINIVLITWIRLSYDYLRYPLGEIRDIASCIHIGVAEQQ